MLMLIAFLAIAGCAYFALRTQRLLAATLWLTGVSTLTAVILTDLGATQLAMVELSVGAGLMTVLFVFVLATVSSHETTNTLERVGSPVLVLAVSAATTLLIAALAWPVLTAPPTSANMDGALWQLRGLDGLVQLGLLCAGVLGVLGLTDELRQLAPQHPAYLPEHDYNAVRTPLDTYSVEMNEVRIGRSRV